MRKMQVPAYCPSLVGVHVVVKRDERAERKKVITMDMLSEEDISDEDVEVEEAIVIADVVVAMVIPDMSILAVVLVLCLECRMQYDKSLYGFVQQ